MHRRNASGVRHSVSLLLIAALALAGVLPPERVAFAQRPAEARHPDLVTPETEKAIERGLEYLVARQHEEGSFGSGTAYKNNVAVTSLAGLALLADGHTPGRGKYGRESQKTVDFILSRCRPNGYIIEESSVSHGPMYGHGFATLYLAEVYGMTHRQDIREKLKKAVELIVNTQNKEGGWRYDPKPVDADVSVTVCQLMALRAARNRGIHVPRETVDKAADYIKRCQNPDGGFRYQLVRTGTESAFPRSAAAVVGLHSAGIYAGREIEQGLRYLERHVPEGDPFRVETHYYYGHYYAVQALWQAGGDAWERWYSAIRDELNRRQLPDGSWSDSLICDEYGTAMALLVLEMPNNYLPIFQR
ncbi:MAG: prenyltransferase/squalene oxidase repeat-containing protein [Planctomycetales bacterium]